MSLHHETRGQGPAIVLLHGWGLHAGLFATLAERLAGSCRVTLVDLPGHGRSQDMPATYTLDILSDILAPLAERPAVWLGWSLGGLVAMNLALRHAGRVRGLALVGATPRFVQAADWPQGMAPEVLAQFVADLERDYRATLNRFLSLQTGGDAQARAQLKTLRAGLFAHGEPQSQALQAGLGLLRDTDLRARIAAIAAPALVIHGSRDRLVPVAAGDWLAARLPRARALRIDGAGHAPFLSHPDRVAGALADFCLADLRNETASPV